MEAKKCRHCQSLLADEQGRPFVVGVAGPPPGAAATPPAPEAKAPPPALWWLLVLNLLCPGYGTWCLGKRLRGFLIMAALLLAALLWAQAAMPLYQKVFNQALKGNANALTREIQAQLDNIIWYKAALAVFAYSFLDVILVSKGY